MRFEYHAFEIAPYLRAGKQPSFVLTDPDFNQVYYTLTDPDTGKFSKTTSNSAVVRIPVFGVKTNFVGNDPVLTKLSHGSLLTATGLEVAARFIAALPKRNQITRVVIVMADVCHELPDKQYKAYFGLTAELQK
jgi:hypothetical protein